MGCDNSSTAKQDTLVLLGRRRAPTIAESVAKIEPHDSDDDDNDDDDNDDDDDDDNDDDDDDDDIIDDGGFDIDDDDNINNINDNIIDDDSDDNKNDDDDDDDKISTSRAFLSPHVTGQRRRKCAFCGVSFASSRDLTTHARMHVERNAALGRAASMARMPRKSSKPSTSQATESAQRGKADRHSRSIRKNVSIACLLCDRVLINSSSWSTHLRLIHDKFGCSRCDVLFVSYELLHAHREAVGCRMQALAEPLKCILCDRRLRNDRSWLLHIEANHQMHGCVQCLALFRRNDELVAHQRRGKCSKNEAVKRNEKLLANKEPSTSSNTAAYASTSNNNSSNNNNSSTQLSPNPVPSSSSSPNKSPRMYPCRTCGRVLTTRQTYRNHLAHIHGVLSQSTRRPLSHQPIDLWLCPACPQGWSSRDEWHRHLLDVHGLKATPRAEEIARPTASSGARSQPKTVNHIASTTTTVSSMVGHNNVTSSSSAQHYNDIFASPQSLDNAVALVSPTTPPQTTSTSTSSNRRRTNSRNYREEPTTTRTQPPELCCPLCSQSYHEPASLLRHLARKHQTGELYCTQCRLALYGERQRLLHAKYIHNQNVDIEVPPSERPRRCPRPGCTRILTDSSSATKHLRRHRLDDLPIQFPKRQRNDNNSNNDDNNSNNNDNNKDNNNIDNNDNKNNNNNNDNNNNEIEEQSVNKTTPAKKKAKTDKINSTTPTRPASTRSTPLRSAVLSKITTFRFILRRADVRQPRFIMSRPRDLRNYVVGDTTAKIGMASSTRRKRKRRS